MSAEVSRRQAAGHPALAAHASRARRELRRAERAARLLAHLVFGLAAAPTLLPLLATPPLRGQGREHRLVRWWMRRLLRILNVHVRLEGRIAQGRVLHVANHISWLDIPCLRAVLDGHFVAKSEVRDWPLIGYLAARAGTVFLRRGELNATAEAADRLTWRLARGGRVIVFPEGTTTNGRELRHFHARLFQAAIRTQGSVQAVALAYPHADGSHPAAPFVGEDNLAGHLWRLLAEERLTVVLRFCEPVAVRAASRRELAEAARAQIASALGIELAKQRAALP
jgi:1-acyl-sn-glycerol-3-phosphate acyltransferase